MRLLLGFLPAFVLLASGCADEATAPEPPDGDDAVPPERIADLAATAVTDSSVTLSWTAPGVEGGTGRAAFYDLRLRAGPIDSAVWGAAAPFLDAPVPGPAGSGETCTVAPLRRRTSYSFALRAFDSDSIGSPLSNVAVAETDNGPPPGGSWHPLGTGIYQQVHAVASFGGELVAGGDFSEAGDRPASNIARWDGRRWHPLDRGTDRLVRCLAPFDGELVAGGSFHRAGGSEARFAALWDGTGWSAMGEGLAGFGRDRVDVLIEYRDRLLAAGFLHLPGGYTMATWDGTAWELFGCGAGTDIGAMALFEGDLYASGAFGIGRDHLCRWDGGQWESVPTGLTGSWDRINALAVYDGELIAAGDFWEIGGVPAPNIAAWDGTAWRPLGAGLDGPAFCLALFDGDLVAGGAFRWAGLSDAPNVARWNGLEWYPFASGADGAVRAACLHEGGLVIAGDFYRLGDTAANRIARWEIAERGSAP